MKKDYQQTIKAYELMIANCERLLSQRPDYPLNDGIKKAIESHQKEIERLKNSA